jgi:hypothetical protein
MHLREVHRVENSPPAMGAKGLLFPLEKLFGVIGLHFQRLPSDLEALITEKSRGRLTSAKHVSRLALLNLALACGNLLGIASLPPG